MTSSVIFGKDLDTNSLISESALRINCFLSSRSEEFGDHRQELVKFIISDSLKSNKSLGDFISVAGLSHLLMLKDTALYFLDYDGMEVLFKILKNDEISLCCAYFSLVCVWSLSYYIESLKSILAKQNCFFDLILHLIECFESKKIIRVVCRIIKNLLLFPKAHSLFFSKVKLIARIKILKKKHKNDSLLFELISFITSKCKSLQTGRQKIIDKQNQTNLKKI